MVDPKITVDVQGMPEVLFAVRKAFAELLRKEAGASHNPIVARRLRQLASEFEVGGKA